MAVIADSNIVRHKFLLSGEITSLLVALISLPLIAIFFWQRLQNVKATRITVASASLLLAYTMTLTFIFVLTLAIHIRIGYSSGLCHVTILACLTLYVLSKMAGFLFLIERAYIISWPINPRHRTPEYVLSCTGIFVPYATATALCIRYRMAINNEDEICIIGIQLFALLPLICVELVSYLYLTLRFLYPLVSVHRDGSGLLLPLRRAVLRTFIGTAIAMISTLCVKVPLTLFNGEPAWLCCMTCKIDATIAACVLHWITQPEAVHEAQGSPQALGIGFETSVPQDSDSNRTIPDSPREFSLKQVL